MESCIFDFQSEPYAGLFYWGAEPYFEKWTTIPIRKYCGRKICVVLAETGKFLGETSIFLRQVFPNSNICTKALEFSSVE
ncbi:unnamed protein product [Blepharisma stoltei]|uniref:Uncharacterized protein n=1 Tax=Blepharisma stoltei TaxID=1481888 RepID=A0AAU9IPL6_9CILI|nr:unnamed protein product [Blepharisma stoltei]